MTQKLSSLERRLWRLWNSWGILGILTVVGLIIGMSFGWLDPDKYAPYVFGVYGLGAGGLLAACPQVFDRIFEKRLGLEWRPPPVATRLIGLFFMFVGIMMVLVQVMGYQ
jgi:hypothetical protein